MKAKLTPLALLIPAVVLAQTFQAAAPVVNQQANPANAASTGATAQTLPNTKNSSPPSFNSVAAAAYEKASKATKSVGSYESENCKDMISATSSGSTCAKNY